MYRIKLRDGINFQARLHDASCHHFNHITKTHLLSPEFPLLEQAIEWACIRLKERTVTQSEVLSCKHCIRKRGLPNRTYQCL